MSLDGDRPPIDRTTHVEARAEHPLRRAAESREENVRLHRFLAIAVTDAPRRKSTCRALTASHSAAHSKLV